MRVKCYLQAASRFPVNYFLLFYFIWAVSVTVHSFKVTFVIAGIIYSRYGTGLSAVLRGGNTDFLASQ